MYLILDYNIITDNYIILLDNEREKSKHILNYYINEKGEFY